jgi:hypothetical protein
MLEVRSWSRRKADVALHNGKAGSEVIGPGEVVGAKGFEPSTSWSRTLRSKNLSLVGCRT